MDPLSIKIIFSLVALIQGIAFMWILSVNTKASTLEKQLNKFQLDMANDYNIKITQLFEKVNHIDKRIDDLIRGLETK